MLPCARPCHVVAWFDLARFGFDCFCVGQRYDVLLASAIATVEFTRNALGEFEHHRLRVLLGPHVSVSVAATLLFACFRVRD